MCDKLVNWNTAELRIYGSFTRIGTNLLIDSFVVAFGHLLLWAALTHTKQLTLHNFGLHEDVLVDMYSLMDSFKEDE